MISTHQIHWIAGILEGEGTFCLTPRNRAGQRSSIRIALSMTDADVVEKLANILGFGSIYIIDNKKNKLSQARLYRWECSGSHAAGLMMTLYSLMGARRQQRIRELLDHWKGIRRGTPKRHPRRTFSFADKESKFAFLL